MVGRAKRSKLSNVGLYLSVKVKPIPPNKNCMYFSPLFQNQELGPHLKAPEKLSSEITRKIGSLGGLSLP